MSVTIKKKGKKHVQAKVLPIIDAETACHILGSPEHNVITVALLKLEKFIIADEYKHLKMLIPYNLTAHLINLLINMEIKLPIKRLVLMILVKCVKYDDIICILEKEITDPTALMKLFLENQDLVILEKMSTILSKICKGEEFRKAMCNWETYEKIFVVITRISKIEVRMDCLKILFYLSSCEDIKEFMKSLHNYHIAVLNCLLKDEKLLPVTLDIFEALTKWEEPCCHTAMFEAKTFDKMLNLLMNEEKKWSDEHNLIIQIITNYSQHKNYHAKNVCSKTFLKYFNFATATNNHHALACITMIADFMKSADAQQVMYDLGLSTNLNLFYKFHDPFINIKLCDTLALMCQNCHMSVTKEHWKYIRILSEIFRNKQLPWVPFRQAAIHPIYIILMSNASVIANFKKYLILDSLREAMLANNEIDKIYYNYILEMYHFLLPKEETYEYLLTPEHFDVFYEHFKSCFEENLNDSSEHFAFLKMLYLTLKSNKYRQLFLLKNAPKFISDSINYHGQLIEYNLITFLKSIICYTDVCRHLMKAKIVQSLRKAVENEPNVKSGTILNMIEQLYKSDITIKFYECNRLDVYNKITVEFTTFLGEPPSYFPYEDPPVDEKLSAYVTMLYVNYTINHDDICYKLFARERRQQCFRKKYEPNCYCIPDYYLSEFAYTLDKNFVFARLSILEKIDRLAKFVCYTIQGGNPHNCDDYLHHRAELKHELESNYIPLGLIRYGGIVERSILFKVLSDRLNVPCSLIRHPRKANIVWNEVIMKWKPEYEKAIYLNTNSKESEDSSAGVEEIIANEEGSEENGNNYLNQMEDDFNTETQTEDSEITDATLEGDPKMNVSLASLRKKAVKRYIKFYLLDLKTNPGALYEQDSKEAYMYKEQIDGENTDIIKDQYE